MFQKCFVGSKLMFQQQMLMEPTSRRTEYTIYDK